MGPSGGSEGVKSVFKIFRFLGHISALKIKFKNRLGESESIHMKGLSPKNEPIRPRVKFSKRRGRLICIG